MAKNVYLTPETSLIRKVKEAMITVQIEKLLTKDEILEKYLNVVEFGDKIYGVKKASQLYFQKAPSQLTEGAFLAFLLPNPKKYSQSFRQKKLTKFAGRQVRIIVDRLAHFKRIGEEEHQSALAQVDRMFGPDSTDASVDEPYGKDLDFSGGTDPEDAAVIGYPAGLEPVEPTE